MVYKGVCARLNNLPDSQGDILSDNFHIPQNPVVVTHNFYEKTRIGSAWVEIEGNEVIAYVNIPDSELFPQEHVEEMCAVIGGSVIQRDGSVVKEWILKNLAITSAPADKTLPKLRRNPKNGCCKYSGPPFRPCRYCGGRETV